MYGGFFHVPKHFSRWAITLRVLSGVCTLAHLLVLITTYDVDITQQVLGLTLYGSSFVIFWFALLANKQKALFHAFTATSPQHLVDWGPYKYVRHPFYLSYSLSWIAGAIATQSRWLWITVVAMIYLHCKAARLEEAEFLRSELSHAYQRYMSSTGFLLPNPGYFFNIIRNR